MGHKEITKAPRWMGKVVMFLLGAALASLLHFLVRRERDPARRVMKLVKAVRKWAKRYKPEAERTLKDLWEAHKEGETPSPPPRKPDPILVAAYVRRNFPCEVWRDRWPWIEEFLGWEFGPLPRLSLLDNLYKPQGGEGEA